MAKKGDPKPSCKIKLGQSLSSYISKSSSCYDKDFRNKIKKLRPDWFITQSDITNQKKEKLIDMAKKGEPKPSCKIKLGQSLLSYVSKSGDCYDEDFTNRIKKLRPDWFITKTEIANSKKEKLLEIAKEGEPKPNCKTKFGKRLSSYISKSSGCYDELFTNRIKKLRPDWFINSVNQKKEKLIDMAKKGKPKPNCKTKFGKRLSSYTLKSSNCYDEYFKNRIKKLRPDWFIAKRTYIANKKKEKLIEIAKKGEPKPSFKTKLGESLSSYISKSSNSYDEEFKNRIKKLRPEWFIAKRTYIANKKKEKLIEIAKKGESKPNKTTKLGQCLSRYTLKSNNCYDEEFINKIKKLRPDWFMYLKKEK